MEKRLRAITVQIYHREESDNQLCRDLNGKLCFISKYRKYEMGADAYTPYDLYYVDPITLETLPPIADSYSKTIIPRISVDELKSYTEMPYDYVTILTHIDEREKISGSEKGFLIYNPNYNREVPILNNGCVTVVSRELSVDTLNDDFPPPPEEIEYKMADYTPTAACIMIDTLSDKSKSIISFLVDSGKEVLRLEGNGDVFLRGDKITNDMQVIEGLREFVLRVNCNWPSEVSNQVIKVKLEVFFPEDVEGTQIEGWMASIPAMPGLAESGATKEDAFRELMISLAVKIAYENNIELGRSAFVSPPAYATLNFGEWVLRKGYNPSESYDMSLLYSEYCKDKDFVPVGKYKA